jgi:peptidoglycan/xylan/chitin deacetylase (PgdA/CDA1 family)
MERTDAQSTRQIERGEPGDVFCARDSTNREAAGRANGHCESGGRMAVVLTGDVHHWISSADRRHTNESETAISVQYARIAARFGLKVTLFFTGRALRDDAADAQALLSMDTVEIAGHGWDAFTPRWLYGPLRRLSGSPHGYAAWQRHNIARTRAVLERFSGEPIRSWRNHGYVHDVDTPRLLAEAGVVTWSDYIDRARLHPYRHQSGVVVLPVNTLPDHENMYHGDRTVATLGAVPALDPSAWCASVLEDVELVVAQGGVATILAHPMCMKVVDDWATFEVLCEGLAGRRTLFAVEAAESSMLTAPARP